MSSDLGYLIVIMPNISSAAAIQHHFDEIIQIWLCGFWGPFVRVAHILRSWVHKNKLYTDGDFFINEPDLLIPHC